MKSVEVAHKVTVRSRPSAIRAALWRHAGNWRKTLGWWRVYLNFCLLRNWRFAWRPLRFMKIAGFMAAMGSLLPASCADCNLLCAGALGVGVLRNFARAVCCVIFTVSSVFAVTPAGQRPYLSCSLIWSCLPPGAGMGNVRR